MQFLYTIDLLAVGWVGVGVVLAVLYRYVRRTNLRDFVQMFGWCASALLQVIFSPSLLLAYLSVGGGACLASSLLLHRRFQQALAHWMHMVPPEIRQREREMHVFLVEDCGYDVKPIHVRIGLAIAAGCRTPEAVTKYIGEPDVDKVSRELKVLFTWDPQIFTKLERWGATRGFRLF